MNAQVKSGFAALSIPSKIQDARNKVKAMAHNDHFPNPHPRLADVTAAVDNLEVAYQAASDGGKSLKQAMYLREHELDALIGLLVAHVQNISEGNPELILSAGFEVRAKPGPIGDLNQPLRLRAATSQHAGEVLLDWKPVHGAKTYLIESSNDGNTGWVLCGHSTGSHYMATGLTSNTNKWFRVAGIGAAGQGPYSDPVKSLAA